MFSLRSNASFLLSLSLRRIRVSNVSRRSSLSISLLRNKLQTETQTRFFAKGQEKGKDKGKQKRSSVKVEDVADFDMKKCNKSMNDAVIHLSTEYNNIHIGRAVPDIIENIQVAAYGGASVTLKSLGQVTNRGSQTLLVNVHDPATIKDVVKALENANLDLSPTIDGSKTIVVPFPKPTREGREKLAAVARGKAEECRAWIRRARKESLDELKKLTMAKDDTYRAEQAIQKVHDDFIEKVKNLSSTKEKELLTA